MKKIFISILCSLSMTAFADSTNSGYINFNSGFADAANLPTGEIGFNLNAGYNFNRGIALEGGYNIFTGSEYGTTVSTGIFDAAVKGTIPLSNVFSLYGRMGLGYAMSNWSGSIVNVDGAQCQICDKSLNSNYGIGLIGVGGSFALDRHWSLRLEDTAYIPFSNTYNGTINAVTFGVQYDFSPIGRRSAEPTDSSLVANLVNSPTTVNELVVVNVPNYNFNQPNSDDSDHEVQKHNCRNQEHKIETADDNRKFVTVIEGDTLYCIAHHTNTVVKDLVEINKIPDEDFIVPTQRIYLK